MNDNTLQEEIDELNKSIEGWAKECERLHEENKILKRIIQGLHDIIDGNVYTTEEIKERLKRFRK